MNTTLTVLLCIGLALVIAGAFGRQPRTWVSGLVSRDRKGRMTIALTPARRRKRRRR